MVKSWIYSLFCVAAVCAGQIFFAPEAIPPQKVVDGQAAIKKAKLPSEWRSAQLGATAYRDELSKRNELLLGASAQAKELSQKADQLRNKRSTAPFMFAFLSTTQPAVGATHQSGLNQLGNARRAKLASEEEKRRERESAQRASQQQARQSGSSTTTVIYHNNNNNNRNNRPRTRVPVSSSSGRRSYSSYSHK